MTSQTKSLNFARYKYAYLLDILALVLVYFIPTLSHMVGIPFYLFEPMRIFVILSLLHSNKLNSYLLAIGLPLFSFFISSHPVFVKAILMTFELSLNVFLFYLLTKKKVNAAIAIVSSLIISKLVYYLIKYILISNLLLNSELISTPIYIQVLTTMTFGIYAYIWIRKKTSNY